MIHASEALNRLKEGHQLFLSQQAMKVNTEQHIRSLAENGQHPFAVIITCSDSRVAPEILFHCQLGDIFTIRTAGNVISDVVLGSIEYAVDHLHVNLVLVLGHTHCGAVESALEPHDSCSHCMHELLARIEPSVQQASAKCCEHAAIADLAEDLNIENAMHCISSYPGFADRKALQICGAKYDIETGRILYWK